MKTNNTAQNSESHIEVLDGLRGIAITMVLLFHVWQISWLDHSIKLGQTKIDLNFIPVTGFLGVELFFFLSAFCLFYPYARYLFEGTKMQTIRRFAYRRAIKILPSYYLSIFLIVIFLKPDLGSSKQALWQIVSHMLFIHNLSAGTHGTINGVFWSLAVEVQFYLLFPLICFLFRKKPLVTYAVMTITSIAFRQYALNYKFGNLDFLLNQLPGFLDIFAAGILAAYLVVLLKNRINFLEKLAPFFSLFSIIMFALMIYMFKWIYNIRYVTDGLKLWQAQNRTYLAVIFILLVVSASLSLKLWQKVLANKIFVFLSVISYNLYIWHQLIARELLQRKIPLPSTPDPHNDFRWKVFFTVIAIISGIVISTVITYAYERPLLKKGVRASIQGLLSIFGSNTVKKKAVGFKR